MNSDNLNVSEFATATIAEKDIEVPISNAKSHKKKKNNTNPNIKKAISLEAIVFLTLFISLFSAIANKMGAINMINTMMNTAFALLKETVFYIMSIAVIAGAIASLLSEFGVIAMINKILSPLIKPIYGLPGAATIGILSCYLSDNPAILTLADDRNFRRYFKKYQLPALTNIGTSFGMGLIITAFMMGITSPTGESFILAAIIGNIGAIIGSIVSTRIMLRSTSKIYGKTEPCIPPDEKSNDLDLNYRTIRSGSIGTRFMDSMLAGGKSGVDMGMAIIPGVLIICTFILILTNGPSPDGYTGSAYEGIAFLPWLGEKIQPIIIPLFGFSSPEAIAVPITSLGAAGAAISLVPKMVASGAVHANDIAVFTAMCMCWSGYLSTHVAMMDSLKCSNLAGKAILAHTFGGLCAGIFANWIYKLITFII